MADELDSKAHNTAQALTPSLESPPSSPGQSSFYTATEEDDDEVDRLSIRSFYDTAPPKIPLSRYNSVHSTPSPSLPTFPASPIESAIAISISNPGSPRLIDIPPSPRSIRGHHATPSNVSDETPPSLVSGSSEDEEPEDILEPLPILPRRSSLRKAIGLGRREDTSGAPRKKLVKKGSGSLRGLSSMFFSHKIGDRMGAGTIGLATPTF